MVTFIVIFSVSIFNKENCYIWSNWTGSKFLSYYYIIPS